MNKAVFSLALALWSASASASAGAKYLYFVTGKGVGSWDVRNLNLSNADYADILGRKKVLDCTWRINQAEFHFGLGQAACESYVTADLAVSVCSATGACEGPGATTDTAFIEHDQLHLNLDGGEGLSIVVESATLYKNEARPMLPAADQVQTAGLNRLPAAPAFSTPPPAEGELRCDIYPYQLQQCW